MPITAEQKLLAIIAHLSFFLGGMGFLVAPLVIYLLKKDDLFVQHHARQALVAHLVFLIMGAAVALTCFLFIGFLLLPFVAIFALILIVTSLIAAYKVTQGELYEYPFIQSFVAWLD